MKISQAERMLNLLALLVDRNRPLTLRAVRQELGKQYPNSDEAARAAFERDKAALREMGIPIETKTLGGDSAGEVTYWVNRSNYELSDLKLSDDERVALQLAVATVRLGAQHGEEALWKLGGEKVLRPTAVSVNIGFVDQNMSSITTAVMQRRTLNFDYKGEKRRRPLRDVVKKRILVPDWFRSFAKRSTCISCRPNRGQSDRGPDALV